MANTYKPFETAYKAAVAKGIQQQTAQSLNFYKQYVKNNLSHIKSWHDVSATKEVWRHRRIGYGGIYTFIYSPKHKDKLPYYDNTPLIIPFADMGKHFMAFNLHYVPPRIRARIMDMLFKINNSKTSDNQRLIAKYNMLMKMSNSAMFEPCIKMYLKNHVRSQFLEFKPEHWELAVFLPTANFSKASMAKVHQDSLNKITNKRRR